MLVELSVRDLGVIADLRLVLGSGMTALTGETGAGKTLLVEAIELLVGGRADPVLVRPGADEAWVEGRFVDGDDEVVLARAVPAQGRSRAYVDGRMATVTALAEAGAGLVDLHGQHAHQSLLSPSAQRRALDEFGGVEVAALVEARRTVARLDAELVATGGDPKARAREADLVRFQVEELSRAEIRDPEEDAALAVEESRLADATAHREAAGAALSLLADDEGVADRVGEAVAALAGREPLSAVESRTRALAAELTDLAHDLRDLVESLDDDPARLEVVVARRHLLHDLRRKYGDTLAEVIAFEEQAVARLAELDGSEAMVARLVAERSAALDAVAEAEAAVGESRREAAPRLASATEVRLQELALPRARVAVEVGSDPGDDVSFLFAANPGEPLLPLAKIASGGELARTMLALRLALGSEESAGATGEGPATLVFDEVDAGIGGEAALAVGRALAALGHGDRQVLVVTHLPQVAAFADQQVAVSKSEAGGRTVAAAATVSGTERVAELSRMLAGRESETALRHAEELLAAAVAERGR